MTTWIVAALDSELDVLKADLHAFPYRGIHGCPCYCSRIGKAQVYLTAVGVGVVSAALGLAEIAVSTGASRVIMVGSAGALPESGLNVGDLAVASSEIMSELGLCVGPGIGDGESLGILDLDQEISLDRDLGEDLLESAGRNANASLGRFLSVMGVSADAGQAQNRALKFSALVENMEGYSLALAGKRFNIKVGEVRAVSNIAGIRDKSAWNLRLANERAQAAVLTFLSRPL